MRNNQVILLALFVCSIPLVYSFCGQWDSQTVGNYILYNDLWGISGADGSQCTTLVSQSGATVSWNSDWSWTGGSNGVKSFANLALNASLNKQLSAISSIPTAWSWSYTYSGSIVGDVAYDIWTSNKAGGSNEYEIMIWLAKYGNAEPISSKYNSSGLPVPIATPTVAGTSYELFAGNVSSWAVYSFVASHTVTSFSADIKEFFTYLINAKLLGSTQYLTGVQAGTEATSGKNAVFTVSKYSVQVN